VDKTSRFRFIANNSLTPWSTVLLERLVVAQLVMKFPVLYITRLFISVLTTACHRSPSWATWIQSTLSQRISFRPILKLSSHLGLQDSRPKFCTHFSSPHECYMSCISHPSWFNHPNNMLLTVSLQIVNVALCVIFFALLLLPVS
jgi:hypothetical protein